MLMGTKFQSYQLSHQRISNILNRKSQNVVNYLSLRTARVLNLEVMIWFKKKVFIRKKEH